MHVHEAENDTTSGKATRGMIVFSSESRDLANTIIGTRLRRSWCDTQRQAVKENHVVGTGMGKYGSIGLLKTPPVEVEIYYIVEDSRVLLLGKTRVTVSSLFRRCYFSDIRSAWEAAGNGFPGVLTVGANTHGLTMWYIWRY